VILDSQTLAGKGIKNKLYANILENEKVGRVRK